MSAATERRACLQAADLAGQLAARDAGGPAAAGAQRLAELEAALAAAQARVGELEAAAENFKNLPALGPRPRRNENKENVGGANGPPAGPALAAVRKPRAGALGSRNDAGEGKVRVRVLLVYMFSFARQQRATLPSQFHCNDQ